MEKKGFTLIELLVVIAIIAILASVLFPVFSKAKAKAQQATCASNLKQLGLAVHMYTEDWDDNLPWNDKFASGNPRRMAVYKLWSGGYVKHVRGGVTQCPYYADVWRSAYSAWGNIQVQYTYNDRLGYAHWSSGIVYKPRNLSDVPYPTTTAMMWDVALRDKNSTDVNLYGGNGEPTNNIHYYPGPHSEGYDILFVDGSVRWMTYNAYAALVKTAGGYVKLLP